ncbi:hypothetical protein [Paenibacillus abyssi]|uniref:DUF4190 domain-containing protein n=1 Tax=Paenibacillus abyssi TaxID=1340531 RepID=A0A917D3N0_9BACL|nr:hypothetical protein [Paenibacillus abyssi]GGG10500.1 hypothetical protein GCM10010916_29210 [Paenibacillus abyssi]
MGQQGNDPKQKGDQPGNVRSASEQEWKLESGKRHSDTEASAEIAYPAGASVPIKVRDEEERSTSVVSSANASTRAAGRSMGWTALGFAIASWFMWGVLLGATAAVLGFVAYRQGSRSLGVWSISLGLIAVATNLVLIPLYYLVT